MKRNKETDKPNRNLKSVLEFLGISNLALAKALDLDPSLISRYLSGERRLIAASTQMAAIAVQNSKFITDIERNFEMAWHYGQPLLKLYDDNFSRNILEILFTEVLPSRSA